MGRAFADSRSFLRSICGMLFFRKNSGVLMYRFCARLIVAIPALALAPMAMAADLKVVPIYVPPPPSWSGSYVGGNLGVGWFDPSFSADFSRLGLPIDTGLPPTVVPGAGGGFSASTDVGIVGGVQAGYNYQFAPQWVAGIEGDFDLTSLRAGSAISSSAAITVPSPTLFNSSAAASTDVNWLASLRGRFGYLWTPGLMLYGTAGVAWADVDYRGDAQSSISITTNAIIKPTTTTFSSDAATSFDAIKTGFVVGAGAEYMWSRNLLLRAEYLFYDINGASRSAGASIPAVFHLARVISSSPRTARCWLPDFVLRREKLAAPETPLSPFPLLRDNCRRRKCATAVAACIKNMSGSSGLRRRARQSVFSDGLVRCETATPPMSQMGHGLPWRPSARATGPPPKAAAPAGGRGFRVGPIRDSRAAKELAGSWPAARCNPVPMCPGPR
jgi:outer membrane immunogenic protein